MNDLRFIPVVRDKWAVVDAEDFDRVNSPKGWELTSLGYVIRVTWRNNKRTRIRLHRLIITSELPHIDHKNHNTLDNRKCNLRPSTCSQNQSNCLKKNKRGTKATSSIYKGVVYRKGINRYTCEIMKNRKRHYIGCFKTEMEAALAYNEQARKMFGEFAFLNDV